MARIDLFECDLCKKEYRPDGYWAHNAHGGAFTVCKDGVNGKMDWESLCPNCRSVLVDVVMGAIKTLAPK